ncbi:MAG: hypothetical protein R3F02_12330 [Thiolinea sp.]
MSLNNIGLAIIFLATGYLGGWLFRADGDARQRFGLIVAFFVVYSAFFLQLWALLKLGILQEWLYTGLYSVGFIYRFFFRHG